MILASYSTPVSSARRTPAYWICIVHASWLNKKRNYIYLSICESNWTNRACKKGSNKSIILMHQVQMGRALQEWEHLAAHFLWADMVHFLAHTSRFRWQSLVVTHLAGGDGFFVDDDAPPLGFSFSFSLFPLSSLLSFFSAPPPPAAAGEGDDDGEDDPLLVMVVVVTTSSFIRAAATAAMVFALLSASAEVEAQAPTAARRMATRSSSEAASASRQLEQAMVAYHRTPLARSAASY